jgi:hypothetical protein
LTVSVPIDREDVIGNQTVGIISIVTIMLEMPGTFIEPINTAPSASDPEMTG